VKGSIFFEPTLRLSLALSFPLSLQINLMEYQFHLEYQFQAYRNPSVLQVVVITLNSSFALAASSQASASP
jgi:hypothetical protein